MQFRSIRSQKKFCQSAVHKGLAAVLLLSVVNAQAQVVYTNDSEGLPLGLVNDDAIKENWDSRYAKGPDEGRVSIVNDAITGKGLRILYPAGGNQSSPSGATWETDIQISADELYMAYWVKFDADFQFVKGGKLPGLAGSTSFPYGDNDFTTRLMWREGGKLEFYLHGFQLDNNEGSEPYRLFWDDFGEHARVIPGQWHHIEIRQQLNTPGQLDGRLQGWLDGVLMVDDSSNSGVRDGGQSNTKINQLYFSTFFGGSSAPASQWQPSSDVYANFDDFIVSTQRIGINGEIPDTPPSNLSPSVTFTSPSGNLSVDEGYSASFSVSASDSDGAIDNVSLFIDGSLIRQINSAPFIWGAGSGDDSSELDGLGAGAYEVLAVATDDDGASSTDAFILTVNSGASGGSDDTCIAVSVANVKTEINLGSAGCIEFSQDLAGRRLAVWDSDNTGACDFRGSLSSQNGSGSLVVPDNYEATRSVSGTVFSVNNVSGNTCRQMKIRAW
ncbi:polysaccharide lyase [Ningiella sp. W23]|uniref:polysaccharide lyase n=1 Tax=Ningiella sp. W23 TaxID=3023715 RepID=UPI00375632FB